MYYYPRIHCGTFIVSRWLRFRQEFRRITLQPGVSHLFRNLLIVCGLVQIMGMQLVHQRGCRARKAMLQKVPFRAAFSEYPLRNERRGLR